MTSINNTSNTNTSTKVRFALNRRWGKALLVFFVALVLAQQAWGIPERRRLFEEREENAYLLIPIVASIPGIGVFAGITGSGSNLGGTGIDVGTTIAQSVDSTDIRIRAYALREVPFFIPGLTLDYWFGDIKFGNFNTFLPGRNSPNYTIPVTGEVKFQLLRPAFHYFQRRLNFSYILTYAKGFEVDEAGNEIESARHGASGDILLDITDDVIDPRTGFRLHYNKTLPAPTSSIFGSNSGNGDAGRFTGTKVEQMETVLYFPLNKSLHLAWDIQYLRASGPGDSGGVVAGGSPPLRGYPGGRWRDKYGVFSGLEARYTIPIFRMLDFFMVRGMLEGVQLAVFYEVGQVNPDPGNELYTELHQSYGAGARMLLEAIVLRFDLAYSDEGPQFHLTIDQPF